MVNGVLLFPAVARQAARAAVPQVIVVGADNHRFALQRTGAIENAYNVLHGNAGTADIDLQTDSPASQRTTARPEVPVDILFEIRKMRIETGKENGIGNLTPRLNHRYFRLIIVGRIA